MKTLYLLRHATAANATPPAMSDFDRSLASQGVREARSVGKFMLSNRMHPDFVLSSSALRTTETAQIIMGVVFGKEVATVPSNFDKELYNAPDEKILAAIQQTDSRHQSLMVVCHNQGVAELAFQLGKVAYYEPGTLSIYTADCDSWADFSPAKAKLVKVFAPEN